MLYSYGFGSGNKVIAENMSPTHAHAVSVFQNKYPHLLLDDDGYAKTMDGFSYCIAQEFNPISS